MIQRRSVQSVWAREFGVWRTLAPSFVILTFAETVVFLFAVGFGLGAYVDLEGRSYLWFFASALPAAVAMNAVSRDALFGTFANLHDRGLYESMVTAPISPVEIVIAEILWQSARAALAGSLAVIAALAARAIEPEPTLLLLPVVFMVLGAAFAIPAISWAIVNTKFQTLIFYVGFVITPATFFSGVFFPVERLPSTARALVVASPLYHAAEASRSLTAGAAGASVLRHLAFLVAVTICLAPIPTVLLTRKLTS